MRHSLVLVMLLCVGLMPAYAQDANTEDEGGKAVVSTPSRDFLMLQFMYSGWLNAPDSVKASGFGRSFNGYICYDFPIKNSHFSFAAGIGVGVDNIYLNDQEVVVNNVNDSVQQALFIPESRNYKRYKVTTAYLEAPFELRFFGNKENRNKGFKTAVGLRVGTLVGAHTKGKEADTKIAYKVNSKRYIENWRFAGTFRIGYGNFTLMGTYNLTNFYKDGAGPVMTPYSIGLCITGL